MVGTKRLLMTWFVIFLITFIPFHVSIALAAIQISSVRVYGNNNVSGIIADDDTVQMDVEVEDAPSLSTDDVEIRLRENIENPTVDIRGNPGSCVYDENRSDEIRQFTECAYAVSATDFPVDMSYSVSIGSDFKVGTFTKDVEAPTIENPRFILRQNTLNFSFGVRDVISPVNQDCSGVSRMDIVNNDTGEILASYEPNLINENKTCDYSYDKKGSLGVELDQSGEHTICLYVFDGVGNRASYCQDVSIDLVDPTITSFNMYRLDLNGQIIGPVRYFSDEPLKPVLVEMNITDQNIRTLEDAGSVTGDVWVDLRNFAPENMNQDAYNVSLKCYELDDESFTCNRVITTGLSPRTIEDLTATLFAQDAAQNTASREHDVQAVIDVVGPEVVSLSTEHCVPSAEGGEETCYLHSPTHGGARHKLTARVTESLSGLNEDYFYFDLSRVNPVYSQRVKAHGCSALSDTVWECHVYFDVPSSASHLEEKPVSVHFSSTDNAGNTLVTPTKTKLFVHDKNAPQFHNVTVTPTGNSEFPQFDGFGRKVVVPHDELEVKFHVSDDDSTVQKVMFDISKFDATQTGTVNATDCVLDTEKPGYRPGKDYVCTYTIQNAQPPASAAQDRYMGLKVMDGAGNIHFEPNVMAYKVAKFEDLPTNVATSVSLYNYQGGSPIPSIDKNLLVNEFNPSGYKLQVPVKVTGITSVYGIKGEQCHIENIGGGEESTGNVNVPIINNPDFYIQGTFADSQNQDAKLFVVNIPTMDQATLENAGLLKMNCSVSYLVGTNQGRIGKDKLTNSLIINIPLRGSLGQGPGKASYTVDKELDKQIESLAKWIGTLRPILDGGLAMCNGMSATLATFTAVREIVFGVVQLLKLFGVNAENVLDAVQNAHNVALKVWECPICLVSGEPTGYADALLKNSVSIHNVCRAFVCDYTIANPLNEGLDWSDPSKNDVTGTQFSYGNLIKQNLDEELQFWVWDGLFDVRNNMWMALIFPTTVGLAAGIWYPPKAVVYPPCMQGIVNSLEAKHRMLIMKKGCLTANTISHNSFECERYEKFYECVHWWGGLGKFSYLFKTAMVSFVGKVALDSLTKWVYESVCSEEAREDPYDIMACWVDGIIHFFVVMNSIETIKESIESLGLGGEDEPTEEDVANDIEEDLGELDL